MSYDLRRLRLHGLIKRIPRKNTYTLTPEGIRVAVFYTKLRNRLLRPLLDADKPPAKIEIRQALKTLETPSPTTSNPPDSPQQNRTRHNVTTSGLQVELAQDHLRPGRESQCKPFGSAKLRETQARPPMMLASIRRPGWRTSANGRTMVLSSSGPAYRGAATDGCVRADDESSTMASWSITTGPCRVESDTRARGLIATRPWISLWSRNAVCCRQREIIENHAVAAQEPLGRIAVAPLFRSVRHRDATAAGQQYLGQARAGRGRETARRAEPAESWPEHDRGCEYP